MRVASSYQHWISSGMVWFRLHVLAVRQKPAHSLQLFKAWWAGNCSSLINTALFVALLGKSLISLVCWRNGNLSSSYSLFATGFGSSNLHSGWKRHSWKMGEPRGSCPSFHSGVAAAHNNAVWLLAAPRLFSPNLWSMLNSVSAVLTERCSASGQEPGEPGRGTPPSGVTLQMAKKLLERDVSSLSEWPRWQTRVYCLRFGSRASRPVR